MGEDNSIPISENDKQHMRHFLGGAFDLIWFTRNQCWKEAILPNVEVLSKAINTYVRKHLKTISRKLNLNYRSQSEKILSY